MNKMILAVVLGAAVSTPAFAQDGGPRDGLRIEARATYETPTVSSVIEEDDVFKIGSAFAFGGELGYDVAVSNAVTVGPYVQYEVSGVESCDGEFCLSGEDYIEGGLSVGYAVGTSGAIYGKLGYGEFTLEATDGVDSVSESGGGVAFALGYEQGFGENFFGRVEGGYADVGELFGLNVQRRHFGVTLGARF
ncbi:outer membrane beta-barrel protein [Aurantiacibacter sp. MUD61]|uniref:outer membrane beta-barrel protein n=1 Tax=Aurantiacibacter sp. MUD61 TaxID=3009083 RepID=UPI0022F10CAE|nr:outer membrane beta-barrel protein [Aurantiacibacter sp. MUD61]